MYDYLMILNDLSRLSPVQPKVRRPELHRDCMMCGDLSTVGLNFYAVADGVEVSF